MRFARIPDTGNGTSSSWALPGRDMLTGRLCGREAVQQTEDIGCGGGSWGCVGAKGLVGLGCVRIEELSGVEATLRPFCDVLVR